MPQYVVEVGELRDDLSVEYVCKHGHISRIILKAHKFEILFDMGASAMLDGYCREAVSSFAAAQERFHEFCIKVFLAKSGITKDRFDATWKHVANMSERQLGAYYFLFLSHFNVAPPATQKVEFRNRVIHKGFIPTAEETTAYAEYVYGYIIETLKIMLPDLKEDIKRIWEDDFQEMLQAVPAGVSKKVVNSFSMIWLSGPEEKFGVRSFQQALKSHKEDHKLELEERLEKFNEEIENLEDNEE